MMHDLIQRWFEWSHDAGYLGVFLLMALESTIVPIPSEVIVPPAAYWAAQGQLSLAGIIAAGGAGSTVGSASCYGAMYYLGRPFFARWGRYLLLPPERLELAERWLSSYAMGGVFFARLLPVVRHLIGFPAGLLRIPFWTFCGVTLLGSTIWTAVLAVFGAKVLGRHPDLLKDPDSLSHALKSELWWFVAGVGALGAGWLFVKWFQSRRTSNV